MRPARQAVDCARHADDLALLAGGDRPAHRPARVDAHLASCASCRAELAELREAYRWTVAARDLAPVFSPADLARLQTRTLAAVRTETRMPVVWWRRSGFSLAGAVAMAAVALLGLPRLAPPARDTTSLDAVGAGTAAARVEVPAPEGTAEDTTGDDLWATLTAQEQEQADGIGAAPAPVRRMKIELRTQDPAIRIVWLAPN